jgi:NADPH:quinone reductase-like Zn-dependent oxidoreductase
MHSLTGHSLGSIEGFELREVAVPQPGPDQVRVRVLATSLGFVDGLMALGKYQIKPDLPYTPGGEIAGVIDAVGTHVSPARIGQKIVTWQLGGGLAEFALVDDVNAEEIGSRVDAVTAASMLVDYQTSYHALMEVGHVGAGDTVLVLGAAGGVGSAAVQMAALAGCRVIAGASTQAKRAFAQSLGATETVDYGKEDWRDELRAKVPGGAVDVVFDPVGGSLFEPAFRSLGKEGRYLVVGFASGAIPHLPVNLALLKSASLLGVEIRHLLARNQKKATRIRQALLTMVTDGRLKPPSTNLFTLDRAKEALLATADRGRLGKVVVVPGRD